jgi:hypothetical protein
LPAEAHDTELTSAGPRALSAPSPVIAAGGPAAGTAIAAGTAPPAAAAATADTATITNTNTS